MMSFINNGRFAGGNLFLTPCAQLNDGLMDCVVIDYTPSWCAILKVFDDFGRG